MDQVTRLLVIRHGETPWNVDSRIQGHTDIGLNAQGRWQAQRLGMALADEAIDAVYSSDLSRAEETAQAIARQRALPVHTRVDLRERHFGCMEGHTHDEIAGLWPQEAKRWRQRDPEFGPQGGEVLRQFNERCLQALTQLARRHFGGTIVVVAHGGVLDCFYRAANRIPLDAPRDWPIGNASINRLLYSPQGFALIGWSDTSHLDAQAGRDEIHEGRHEGRHEDRNGGGKTAADDSRHANSHPSLPGLGCSPG